MVRIAAALVVATATLVQGGVATQFNVRDLPDSGVRLIPSTDPAYEAGARRLLQGSLDDPTIQAERSFSALLTNNSKRTIVAYAVRYTWTSVEGKTSHHDMVYHSFRTRAGYQVPPMGVVLVAPGRSMLAPLKGTAALSRSLPSALNEASRMALQASITLSIDGIIFEDGTFVGPDESNAYQRISALLSAPRELMTEVLRRRATGESSETIVSDLQRIARERFGSATNVASIEWTSYYRGRAARSFLQFSRAMGEEAAYTQARRIAQGPIPALTKR